MEQEKRQLGKQQRHASQWRLEEIEFLKRSYATYSVNEIAIELGRTAVAVKSKALLLGLKQINPNTVIVNGQKRCSVCKQMLDLEFFYPDKRTKTSFTSHCRICKNAKGAETNRLRKLKEQTANETYTCKGCGVTQPGWHFKWSTRKEKRESRCLTCRSKIDVANKLQRIKEGRDW